MKRERHLGRAKAPPSSQRKPPSRDVGALLALLNARAQRPHEWGDRNNDCIAFIAAAVKAQTGRNPARGLKWSTKTGALRLLARLGGVEAVLDARFDRIPVAHAHRGDIAGIPDPELGLHPMIVEGETLCTPGQRGLKRAPRSAMTHAWDVMSVGRVRRVADQPSAARSTVPQTVETADPTAPRRAKR